MVKIKVSRTLEKKIRNGYPWIFHYQVQNENINGQSGDLAVVYDYRNRFLAIGLLDFESDIRFRALHTCNPVKIDRDFFEAKLNSALKLRDSILSHTTTGYRVINGENDGFPGLILDRYQSTIVLKLYTSAWIPYLDTLACLFKNHLPVNRCVLRWSRKVLTSAVVHEKWSDGSMLFGDKPASPICFKENGISFKADVISGQKTGFFLDQRDNRQYIRSLSREKSVLNVFSYTGAFSIYSFIGGARSVLEVDYNPIALAASKNNLRLNFPNRIFLKNEFRQLKADGFNALSEFILDQQKFELIILDPPAFAKRNKQAKSALNAYTKLVEAAAKVSTKNGILFAASCSVHVKSYDFYKAVFAGIHSAGRKCQEIRRTGHADDHPVTFSQGEYLKGIFCKIS